MPKAALYNAEGIRVGDLELRDDIFGIPVQEHVLHQAVVRHLANRRSGTASTKNRGEVQGSGRKPWRQKGTGRARVGSIRSPLWRKGGIVFGPKPRSYSQALPKKMRRLAVKSALSTRVQDGDLIVIEDIRLPEPKTREVARLLENLEAKSTALLVLPERDEMVERAARNLPGVGIALANQLNAYDLLAVDKVIMTKNALARVGEVLAGA
ncbi:MAG TPA: 50S ribosomal protein L4 [Syntrophomonadaceae bacterium]|nr:50S ribosomal protein L4 [Syntrophomonadaceae bacterium]